MTVTTTNEEHVYRCDLCGSASTNLYTLDLHRLTLGGPEGPDVDKPDGETILDICYWCRNEIRSSHIEARVILDDQTSQMITEDVSNVQNK